MSVSARRFCTEVTERVGGKGPALEVPLARLSVRSADAGAVFLKQRIDGKVAVHRLHHLQTGTIESNQRKIVVEWCKPPLVVGVLIGDKVRNMPSQECARLPGQFERFMNGNGWLHGGPTRSSGEAYTTSCDSRKDL